MSRTSLPSPQASDLRGVHGRRPYELWLPPGDGPFPAMVVLHGAGSRKENQADFARVCRDGGWAAVTFDQRGHGESRDAMSPAALGDVETMVELLMWTDGVDAARICVRGSSMGGLMAIHAAATIEEVAGVIAICPASEEGLRRELKAGELDMRADTEALDAWLTENDLRESVKEMGNKPLLLIHAKGDERIPYTWSEELAEHAEDPSKLIVVPGGHHRSAQHDMELQGIALRWLERALDKVQPPPGTIPIE